MLIHNDSLLPSVTFLICTNVLNKYVYDSLNSCLIQTYQNYELVVVVNGEDCDYIFNNLNFIVSSLPKLLGLAYTQDSKVALAVGIVPLIPPVNPCPSCPSILKH